jgi:hypothetical protein
MKLFSRYKQVLLMIVLSFVILMPMQSASAVVVGFGDALYQVLDPAGIDKSGSSVQGRFERSIGNLINIVLGFIGVIILGLVIYAGVLWATARGNEQTVQKAKDIMLGGIIGLIIVFTAAGVVSFVITQIGQTLNR